MYTPPLVLMNQFVEPRAQSIKARHARVRHVPETRSSQPYVSMYRRASILKMIRALIFIRLLNALMMKRITQPGFYCGGHYAHGYVIIFVFGRYAALSE